MATYMKSVEEKTWDFPDFQQSCPICGAKDCCVRIGFYYRKQVIIDYETFENVPIARYLCRKKGTQKTEHRTFSLLPHQLIPYRKNGLNLAFETVAYQQKNNARYCQIKSFIGSKGKDDYLSIENKQIDDFQNIFAQAFKKIMKIDDLKQQIKNADWYKSNNHVANMIKFIENYNSPFLKGNKLSQVEILSLDFFSNIQTGRYFDRHFLFGANSQKLNSSI